MQYCYYFKDDSGKSWVEVLMPEREKIYQPACLLPERKNLPTAGKFQCLRGKNSPDVWLKLSFMTEVGTFQPRLNLSMLTTHQITYYVLVVVIPVLRDGAALRAPMRTEMPSEEKEVSDRSPGLPLEDCRVAGEPRDSG